MCMYSTCEGSHTHNVIEITNQYCEKNASTLGYIQDRGFMHFLKVEPQLFEATDECNNNNRGRFN